MIETVVDEVLRKMESTTNEGIKAADDYMDTDTGLLMCGQCHTKKQKKISFLGMSQVIGFFTVFKVYIDFIFKVCQVYSELEAVKRQLPVLYSLFV